ncbi:MAG TPA: Hsp70 family protein [Syntrophobacteraceae bacterium]|nr:Hsp70 family protein [Syntrophobacteraceae bacterium]
MNSSKFILGIDLGTTHSVLAYTEARAAEDTEPIIRILNVPQILSPGELKAQPLLPSFIFLPGPHDVPHGSLALPWDPQVDFAVGEFARKRGAELPNRMISSSKSWLCHSGVDRLEKVLPWEGPPDAGRLSPVEASARFLQHLKQAWDYQMAAHDPDARFEAQDIYLTVPASFDAVARELTVKAAQSAGLENITLLEEPQAAFYAWVEAQKERWRKAVHLGESILVFDVGGGTTDFSLIQVTEENGELTLRRVAVGDHLMLGGDNMDLTLAYAVQARLAQKGIKLDTWQFRGLWYSARVAKERLLADPELHGEPVVILGRGSSLIGGTIRSELTRTEVEQVLLDGFFPVSESSEYPEDKPKIGVREMGLPYESDPAVTRHLARFLGRQAQGGLSQSGVPVAFPSAILFNGGVMKSELLRKRVLSVLNRWSGTGAIRELPSVDLDLAVARGAAYYGLARRGRGIRIRGGTARSYYIGIETSMPSVPGVPTPMKALCVVPFGMEEGSDAEIRQREFGLVVGEPAVFHLLDSTIRRQDETGEIVEDWQGDIEQVTTMEAVLPATEQEEGGKVVPVWLQSKVTEVGTLELWCVAREEDRRWKLEFNLREREQE